MKVLFLTHNYPRRPGDASGNFLQLLAKSLRNEGVEVHVVAPADAGVPESESLDGIQIDRFRYAPKGKETIAYGNMASEVRGSWGARVKLLGFLGSEFRCAVRARRAFEPDVIHAHWWFPNGLVGTWTARMSDKPLVTTLHGTDVRLAKSVAFSRPGFRHVLQHSAAVTAVSQFLADETHKVVSTSARPQVAPMPVATDLFSPTGNGARQPNRLLFVGRLNAQKGIEMLLRAIAVATHKPTLDVVGDGPDEERLKALATELEIDSRVRWIGALPQQQLTEYYRSATALVVPSVNEGLGLVAVEAQLCETPVIAFDSGGLSDVVSNQRTGILVEDISASALAAAIDSLLASPDRGAAMGAAGRLHALATFAPESVARRYATLYRSVARAS